MREFIMAVDPTEYKTEHDAKAALLTHLHKFIDDLSRVEDFWIRKEITNDPFNQQRQLGLRFNFPLMRNNFSWPCNAEITEIINLTSVAEADRTAIIRALGVIEGIAFSLDDRYSGPLLDSVEVIDCILNKENTHENH